jgi:TolB-like protein
LSFFEELKRRNVVRVGVAYGIAAWVLLQVADLVLEAIEAPGWVIKALLLVVAIGFIVAIVVAWAYELTPEGIKRESEVDRTHSITGTTGKKLDRIVIVFLLIAVAVLLYRQSGLRESTEPSPGIHGTTGPAAAIDAAAEQRSQTIAVLPFRDMSAAGDQAYFGEGIAEELLNALVKLDGLEVASRTSAFSLAQENLSIPALAERLNVAHVLEGSIRTSGQQVRVTAQLIDVEDDVHLWSETYDGTLDDIFKIQDEITAKITEALKVQLAGLGLATTSDLLTDNAEAYRAYLQGRHLWRRREPEGLHRAVELFQRAVEIDPDFHQAWSNMGLAYFNLPDYDATADFHESYALGVEAANKALSITPDSSEALIIKADYEEKRCRIVQASELYEKALALNPNDPTVYHWYQILLANAGHNERALRLIEKAREIDPLIAPVISNQAQAQTALGNHDEARRLYREAIAIGFPGGNFDLGKDYLLTGETEQGLEYMLMGTEDGDPNEARILELFASAYKDADATDSLIRHIGPADQLGYFDIVESADLLAMLGSDYVFEHQSELDCPSPIRSFWLNSFREQRRTPEFFGFMERAGFVAFWREHGWPDDCESLDQNLAECPE